MRSFVVMGGCKTLALQVLLALRSAGNFKCVLLGGPETRSLRYSMLCKERIEIDFEQPDDEHLVRQLQRIARRYPDATLVPTDCASVRMLSRVGAKVPFRTVPLPDVETMDMFDDKWRFFRFCREHDLPVPDTVYIGRKHDLDFGRIVRRLGLPFIVKPSNEAGSNGVQVVRNEADFRDAVLGNQDYAFTTLIAQRYIAGTDVCIDVFALDGSIRAIALRERVGANMRFFDNEQMRQLAGKVVSASRYNGVMNMDARIEDGTGRVYLIESNPRYWATLTASAGAGLNFVAQSIFPSVDEAAPVAMLTDGEFNTRHPLTHPAAWRTMLFDTGGHGRLLRARMASLQDVRVALKSLASKFGRILPQLTSRGAQEDEKTLYPIQRR